MSTTGVRARLDEVRERIARAAGRAGRDPAEVAVIGVTKNQPGSAVAEAVAAGIEGIGENRAQELLAKAEQLESLTGRDPADVSWHFVGRIQRNKVRKLAPLVSVWHSVDRVEVADAIARHAPGSRVFIQVNVGGEEQKGGCAPEEVVTLVGSALDLGLEVVGLMTVPPLEGDPRPVFVELRRLATDAGVAGLSMGMSSDFEIAVEEGATVVRLGTALFGGRDSRADPR